MATVNALNDTCVAFTAGETVTATLLFDSYHADSYSCRYEFRAEQVGLYPGNDRFGIDATTSGTSFLLTLPAATSEELPPGDLVFTAYVTKTSDSTKKVADSGVIRVKPNPAVVSYNARMLAAVRAVMEGRANNDQLTTQLGDVQLKYMSPTELERWEGLFAARVRSEIDVARRAAG